MKKGSRILIVDDNPVNRELLSHHIANHPEYEPYTAEDGQGALTLVRETTVLPDLILLDVMMPDMDGYEVAKRLKKSKKTRDIPIVFITALDDIESKIKAFENGGVDYISKPFHKDELLARVTAQVRLKRLSDELKARNKELHELNQELETKKRELEHLNNQKNQFIGVVAHDLRNPITVIMGTGDLLKMKLSNVLNENHLKYLTMINSSSLFMLNLINDLLDIQMIEAGKLTLQARWTDMVGLVRRCVELSNFLSEYKNIRIHFDYTENQIELFVDPSKMEQVLNNLLSNAVKFSNEGSEVHVYLKKDTSQVDIVVKDEGQGIPADELRTIFKPYEKASVRPTAGEKSIGLGLAIVKKIVEGHKGTIKVESQVGTGSVFTVSFPEADDATRLS